MAKKSMWVPVIDDDGAVQAWITKNENVAGPAVMYTTGTKVWRSWVELPWERYGEVIPIEAVMGTPTWSLTRRNGYSVDSGSSKSVYKGRHIDRKDGIRVCGAYNKHSADTWHWADVAEVEFVFRW